MPDASVTNTLLAIMASLVGVNVWVVKALMARSERLIEARDHQIGVALEALTASVQAFQRFEAEEERVHRAILDGLTGVSTSLDEISRRLGDTKVKP